MRFLVNPHRALDDAAVGARASTRAFAPAVAADVRAFHASLDGYSPTPLLRLDALASRVGVDEIWLKDESGRFGLGSFKALGASHAVARLSAGLEATATFVTATDGNHGRALAWAARRLGHRSVVFLPAAASGPRAEAIEREGAEVRRVDGTYDAAVAAATAHAEAGAGLLVQDAAWPGYEEVPRWIMQGYLTVIDEVLEQIERPPTHVLLQCGVGSFAAASIAGLVERADPPLPCCVLVEPEKAACALAAVASGGEEPPMLEGDTHGFMACLSCGRLSHGAWPILRSFSHTVVACPDEIARRGMRLLGRPEGDDPSVVSGESGAVTTGLIAALGDGEANELTMALGLSGRSRVLLVSTEGATDPRVYRRTVEEPADSDAPPEGLD